MDSPSAQLIATASVTLSTITTDGRELTLKRLGALDRLRLFKLVGADLAQNASYLGMAMLATSVTAINGIPVPTPATEGQLEALVQQLGNNGFAAIANTLTAEPSPLGKNDQGN